LREVPPEETEECMAAMNRLIARMARGQHVHPVIRVHFAFLPHDWFSLTLKGSVRSRGRPPEPKDPIINSFFQEVGRGVTWARAIGHTAREYMLSKHRVRQILREGGHRKRKFNPAN